MADPRGLAAALAPFHEVRKHLQATQARLSALLTTITGEAAARTGNLERLPAAARFNPFSVAVPFNPFSVLPKVVDAANAAETGAKAGARRADAGKRAAATAGARPAASGSAALAGLARAADSLRQAPVRAPDLPPSAAALTAAALGVADASAQARAAAQAPADGLPASAQAARAHAAGDLIEALLKRHAPPRAATRLHGTGARSAPTSDDGDAAPARRTAAASAARTAPAADHPAARDALNTGAAATRGSRLARGEELEYAPPSRLHAASAPWDELADRTATRTIAAMDATPIAAPSMHAAALDHGDAVLRSLLDADPLRPTAGAQALDGATPASGARAPSRSPLQRAPSRLLATVGTGPVAQQPAAAASLHAAVQMPTGSAPGDSAAGLAENLDRLLREQAWLRGVDLT